AETFSKLKASLEEVEADAGTQGNRLFYLAMPPDTFEPIARQLARAGLSQEKASGAPWRRVVVEKPFGTDLASARALNRALLEVLTENQIYRIDHYLGKETVQNILLLRFANGLFEPIWNRNHIDHVQITVAETVNVERRGRFYD
ncbi:glucose-6-phosphate dehydrogenase, partial [Microvirga sp. 3-52]|nr:glucose-6-phosphate dehydrogenase [Microvirga sp. 3-52]